ncbi:unnamed protein product [Candidula unifasciata]|uniref:Uncharacterized protein n=1 Tax=Candidula unifasciata TaxID=100452 RepID=A0A8S3Z597_9EUPU|nr:unnamed protein product [Candidula unifasciata]
MACRSVDQQNSTNYNGAVPADMYLVNRNTPYYPPDPCIKPDQGYAMCQPQHPPCPLNYKCMPAVGSQDRSLGEIYQFDRRYPFAECQSCEEYHSHPCAALGPISSEVPCPCTHRCPVFLRPKPYDLNLMYPKCVDRPPAPHFETPIYGEPTPYIRWSSTHPQSWATKQQCRVPFSKHLKCQCPNSAPSIGPNLVMFLHCSDY